LAPDAPGGQFPLTRQSIIVAARSAKATERRQALDALVAAYWKPVYKYLRLKWRVPDEDARDLTQAFFTRAIEKDFFARFDPAKARFRTYVRVCLDGFVANERKSARRFKRGGDVAFVSLDFQSAEGELRRIEVADDLDLDQYFHREWVRSLFGNAVDELRACCEATGRARHFAAFARYDLADETPGSRPTYATLAQELGISVTDVTNHLASARREFRRIVLDRLREICTSEEEFQLEARQLLALPAVPLHGARAKTS
jgi:RNA polymerase sigma factor (sigma-70 family)